MFETLSERLQKVVSNIKSKGIINEDNISDITREIRLCPLYTNDIVMVMSDLPNGKALSKCFLIDKDNTYTLNQRICLLRVNENINPKYLFYKISRNPYFLKFDDGVNQTNLKKDDILNIYLSLPEKKYQDKYSLYLTSVDKKILLEKIKLNNLFQLKKGLMQNMFV